MQFFGVIQKGNPLDTKFQKKFLSPEVRPEVHLMFDDIAQGVIDD